MKLSVFTLCDYAQSSLGKLTIVGAFNRIYSDQFPFAYRQGFNVVGRIVFTEPYSDKLNIEFKDPDGNNVLPSVSSDLKLEPQIEGRECAFDFNLAFNPVLFHKPGVYKIHLSYGNISESLTLYFDETPKK